MKSMTPICPLPHFRVFVAQRLQKAPFGWGGSAGYQLERRYNDLTQQYWDEGETVDDTAQAIHTLHMSRPTKVATSTRASLQAAGCGFDDLEEEVAQREREEWEGLSEAY